MSWRLAFLVLAIGALLLLGVLGLPAVAAGPGGTGIEDAAPLTGIQSGTLAPRTSYWYQFRDESPRGPSPPSLLMNYTPTYIEQKTHITFKVWKYDSRLTGQAGIGYPYSIIGEGTQGPYAVGVKYWRASPDPGRTYYVQVVNDSYDNVDFAITIRGDLPTDKNLPTLPIIPGWPPRDVSPGAQAAPPTPTATVPTGPVMPPAPTPTISGEVAPPASRTYTDTTYVISETRQIGAYTIRFWRGVGAGTTTFVSNNIVTIAVPGQPTEQVETVYKIDELSGKDITGEGNPDLILDIFSGGAHCCFSTVVYDLGSKLTKVMDLKPSNCSGKFADIDNDGKYEYVTCDDAFAYKYCPYVSSPVARVIFKYIPGQSYTPVNPQYSSQYDADIGRHLNMAEDAQPGGLAEWDGTSKCAVLPLVLDYLYSGRTAEAWETLYRYYPYPDVEDFRAEIEQTIAVSGLYVAP